MKCKLLKGELAESAADLLAIGCFEGGKSLDRLFDKKLEPLLQTQGFQGTFGETRLIFPFQKTHARSLLVVGLGKKEKLSPRKLQYLGGILLRESEKVRARSIALHLHDQTLNDIETPARLTSLVQGMLMHRYRFEHYTAKKDPSSVEDVFFVTSRLSPKLQRGLLQGEVLGKGLSFTRDLINAPGNIMTPEHFASEAMTMAKEHHLQCTCLGEKQIVSEKMGGLLAVAKGSEHPPQFLHLRYQPKSKSRLHVALVGKAITFDTGGISLKEVQGMEKMKYDVGGGATILGTLQVISHLKPNITIDAYIPVAENMPDGKAFRPGDIITARNGKTIEIITTDAEGRLILADALSYAADRHPDYLIDLGTLTGAAVQALGSLYAGLFGNHEKLLAKLLTSARASGEYLHAMPLEEEYFKSLVGGPADLRNKGSAPQMTTCALFLQEFVNTTAWAHIDMAPCCVSDEETPLVKKNMATGAMVPTLTHFLCNL